MVGKVKLPSMHKQRYTWTNLIQKELIIKKDAAIIVKAKPAQSLRSQVKAIEQNQTFQLSAYYSTVNPGQH